MGLLYTGFYFSARLITMNLRKSSLQPGWYPQNSSKINEFIKNCTISQKKELITSSFCSNSLAAAVPHAGWYYSGSIAVQAVGALAAHANQCDTVAVIGGHLPGGMPALLAMEDAVYTPLGNMEIDNKLRKMLINSLENIPGLRIAEDHYNDNTIEVLLPMVKYFFPESRLLWLRFPADMVSYNAGKTLAKTVAALGRNLLVIGSTDLTHYGDNYRWSPVGYGQKALDWVKTVNDKNFIDAVEAGQPDLVLARAEDERSSCSAGAVLGVMGYAEEVRATEKPGLDSSGKLLAYSTSADISIEAGEGIPGSFVGYGAFLW